MKRIVIKEKELELRLVSMQVAKELFGLVDANRKHLRSWLPWLDVTKGVRDTKKFIKRVSNKFKLGQEIQFAIYLKGDLVGMIGLHHLDKPNRKVMIGYWLSKGLQGQGVMTRACKLVMNYGFRKLKLNRIEIQCAVGNKKSCAIPERLGFKLEGVRRQAEWLYNHFVDLKVYGMLAKDWKK